MSFIIDDVYSKEFLEKYRQTIKKHWHDKIKKSHGFEIHEALSYEVGQAYFEVADKFLQFMRFEEAIDMNLFSHSHSIFNGNDFIFERDFIFNSVKAYMTHMKYIHRSPICYVFISANNGKMIDCFGDGEAFDMLDL